MLLSSINNFVGAMGNAYRQQQKVVEGRGYGSWLGSCSPLRKRWIKISLHLFLIILSYIKQICCIDSCIHDKLQV